MTVKAQCEDLHYVLFKVGILDQRRPLNELITQFVQCGVTVFPEHGGGLFSVTLGNHPVMSPLSQKQKAILSPSLCCDDFFFKWLSKVFATVLPSAVMSPPADDMKGKTSAHS